MAESPDYQPIQFTPYPSDPAQYVTVATSSGGTTSTALTVESLTDSKLYVIKQWTVRGTVVNLSTTAISQPFVTMQVLNGLDDGGTAAWVDAWSGMLPVAAASTGGDAASFNLEAPTPLVVRAGTVGTPNNLRVTWGSNSGTFQVRFYTVLLMWPLS